MANGPRTFLLSIKAHEGRGRKKEALAKGLLHMFRDEPSTSQNRKYHPLKLDVGRFEELCETVPLSNEQNGKIIPKANLWGFLGKLAHPLIFARFLR